MIKNQLCFTYFIVLFCASASLFCRPQIDSLQNQNIFPIEINEYPIVPENLAIFQISYPDITFEPEFDSEINDWKITLSVPRKNETFKTQLYWANGSFLPKEALAQKEKHWTLLYSYDEELRDPATFTQEEIERIRNYSSPNNRQNGAGTPQFFFDAVYDCETQNDVEKYIKKTTFLKKTLNVHERIIPILKDVELEIIEEGKTDKEVQDFINELYQAEGYFWRTIRDTTRKSFHSIGIAVDILPRRWGHKIIYWNWQAQIDPENWMLTPLSKRWMPPQKVIQIFEEHGFIWGGKWGIWDNMHFEYHPEILLFQEIYKNKNIQ